MLPPMKAHIESLLRASKQLLTLLIYPPKDLSVDRGKLSDIVTCIEGLIAEVASVAYSFFIDKAGEVTFVCFDLLKNIDCVMEDLKEVIMKAPLSSKRNLPRTNGLGFIDSLLRYLKELQDGKYDSVIKHLIAEAQEELSLLLEKVVKKKHDFEESWELLQIKLFNDQTCPSELREVGCQIARECQGIPLLVILVAGVLMKKEENWRKFAESINSDADIRAKSQDIIELSYKYLPDYLKPCLLYFASFRKDEEIPFSNFVWLWTIEGFVLNTEAKSVELVAKSLLNDLIGRSLIMVNKKRSIEGVRSCHIHYMMYDFCARKAMEERFMQLTSTGNKDLTSSFYENRRLCINHSLYWASGMCHVGRFILEIKRVDSPEVLRNQRLCGIYDIMDIEPFKPRGIARNNSRKVYNIAGVHLEYAKLAAYMIKKATKLRKLKCHYKEPLKLKLDALPLESLNVNGWILKFSLPLMLTKLTLSDISLPQSETSNIGSLPNLVVLKWNASDESLPNLKRLLVESGFHLQEIPSAIGDILTLKMIEVKRC
ncbi:putative late blight resistance protein homolog R1A-10, partial [Lycium ferocissimum]|uniref:putative late blight resistance protein homolog R1A-10 n=1 Tax=Lycium ferocissimum TaxID=112874 RepID=UPI00281631DF